MGVTGVLPGAQVHREAVSCEKIVVERGSAVNLVHHDAPNSPPSPNPPRKISSHRTGELIEADGVDVSLFGRPERGADAGEGGGRGRAGGQARAAV